MEERLPLMSDFRRLCEANCVVHLSRGQKGMKAWPINRFKTTGSSGTSIPSLLLA